MMIEALPMRLWEVGFRSLGHGRARGGEERAGREQVAAVRQREREECVCVCTRAVCTG